MGRIFVSYRRSDSAGHTGRLVDYLVEEFGDESLFRDIEKIQAGEDFVEALEKAVSDCSVMLVVIGPQWARAETKDGKRRLKQPGDFVRMEIEAGLARGVPLIPVLVGDAGMPEADDLPESMLPLLRRHAHSTSDRRWAYDVGELLAAIEKVPGVPARRRGVAPASGGMATWKKGLIAGAVLLPAALVLGLIFVPLPEDEKPAAASGAPPATSPSPTASPSAVVTDVSGGWRDEAAVPWHIQQAGQRLVVTAGSAVEKDLLPPRRPGQTDADEDFPTFRGEGTVVGGIITVDLRDADTGHTSHWVGTVAADGKSVTGTMTNQGDPAPFEFTLSRN